MNFLRFGFVALFLSMSGCPAAELKTDTYYVEPEPEPSPITWTECSGKPGEKACDFTFVDQDGQEWSLYDNYGKVIIVDFSAMWCGPCNSLGAQAQAHQDYFTEQGKDVLFVTVLVDDYSWGNPPDEADLNTWVNNYGMTTSPVLAGDRSVVDPTAEDGYPITSWPTIVVIDKSLTIHNGINGWSEAVVYGWVNEALEKEVSD